VKWLPILGDECETDSNTSDDEMSSIENTGLLQELQARERELTERSTTSRAECFKQLEVDVSIFQIRLALF